MLEIVNILKQFDSLHDYSIYLRCEIILNNDCNNSLLNGHGNDVCLNCKFYVRNYPQLQTSKDVGNTLKFISHILLPLKLRWQKIST